MSRVIKIFVFAGIAIILFLGGFYLLKKKNSKKPLAEPKKEELAAKTDNAVSQIIFRKEYDLEQLDGIENTGHISEEKACSGTKSNELNKDVEYGINLVYPVDVIFSGASLEEIIVQAAVWTTNAGEAQWVFEVQDSLNKSIHWISSAFEVGVHHWDTLSFSFQVNPDLLKKGNKLRFYPWNKSHENIWIDNISIKFIGSSNSGQRRTNNFKKINFLYGFEPGEAYADDKSSSNEMAHSGERSVVMPGADSYGVSIVKKASEVMDDSLRKISVGVWIYPERSDPDVVLVVSIKNTLGEAVFWGGISTDKLKYVAKKWQKFNVEIFIPTETSILIRPEDEVIVYLWNRRSMKVFADDLEIVYGDWPQPKGILPYADMNLVSRKSYTFDRYHPPYRIEYANYTDIHNSSSTYLVSNGKEMNGNVFPSDEIISFHLKKYKTDCIAILRDTVLELFQWCDELSRFSFIGSTSLTIKISGEKTVLAIDADGDNNDELLLIAGSEAFLFDINNSSDVACTEKSGGTEISLLWRGMTNEKFISFIADINHDGKKDWLSINSQDLSWEIKTFSKNSFEKLASGVFQSEALMEIPSIASGYFLPGNKNFQLLMTTKTNTGNKTSVYEYISLFHTFKSISSFSATDLSEIFSSGDRYFQVNLDNDPHDELILMRQDWRFSMRLIDCDSKGFYVRSQIEFKDYPASCNPKYYEMIKAVTGRFMNTSNTSLMMVLRNCADQDFDGRKCKSYGGSPDLPDQIQMYNLKFN